MEKTNPKPAPTAEQKQQRKKAKRKKAWLIIGILVVLTAVLAGVGAAANAVTIKKDLAYARTFPSAACAVLDAENYADGCWFIHTDNGLDIMQLTDVHIGGGFLSVKKDRMALNAVAAMITQEKPDLVIVTGDVGYPVPFQAGTFNNKNSAKCFATLMESLGVYWTIGYGNHDTELYSFFSREQITDFYSSGDYPHCLVQRGPADIDGCGNQLFNLINSDGIITRSLFVIDSNTYTDGDYLGIRWKYDNVHQNQIDWYRSMVEDVSKKNHDVIVSMNKKQLKKYAGYDHVPSSVFQHIPLTEYRDAWKEYVNNGCRDTEDVKLIYGTAGESGRVVYCPAHDDAFFETITELGSTDTVFCGHDHLNNFSLEYKGVRLSYGCSVDYLAYPGIYKLGTQRGCLLIAVDEDGNIRQHPENYYQDKYVPLYEKEPVTMQTLEISAVDD